MHSGGRPGSPALQPSVQRVLVTGGAGFIGGALVRRLLTHPGLVVVSLDKMGYASDLSGIQERLAELGLSATHQLLQVDLSDAVATQEAVRAADPDLVFHLAAESHVDRSIDGPAAFVQSNVVGTFHLLEAVRAHWQALSPERSSVFRFHHISTDEVFGSLGTTGRFSETTPYDPRSPYSATKAASDHLVMAWYHTYGLPVLITNCSNNYGPWQFPEKLVPVVIHQATKGESIPLYGDGAHVRDWLYVEDHVDALLLAAAHGRLGESYGVGGSGECTNRELVTAICAELDVVRPQGAPHARWITTVADRPGHDRRYAIDPSKISTELGWQPRHSLHEGLRATIAWYLSHSFWLEQVQRRSGYRGGRLGALPTATSLERLSSVEQSDRQHT